MILLESGATSNESPAWRTAERVESAIRGNIVLLSRRPGIGHWRKDLTDQPVRFYLIYSYLIIYRPDTRPLEVVAILHGRRDVAEVLKCRL